VSAKRCTHGPLKGPSLDGLVWCSKCDAEVIHGFVVADALDAPKIPWSVEVEKLSGENNFRTMFKVGVQGFTLAHAEDEEAEAHCHRIAKFFREAMSRAGYRHVPAEEDWALNQLIRVSTLVGSHNAAEVLGDVRVLFENYRHMCQVVVELSGNKGPMAEDCKKQLAELWERRLLADAIDLLNGRKEPLTGMMTEQQALNVVCKANANE
jgi:hypothetical protein